MTVSSQTNNATFVGNGVTTAFPLPFRFFDNGHVYAYFIDRTTGASTPMMLGADFTLIGAGEPEVDGNALSLLTTTVPLASMRGLYVERVMPQVQETDIVNQGQFFASTHEDVFDRLTMLIQQANANSAGAIRVAVGDPEPARLAPAAQRANLLMGFDSLGNPIVVAPASGSATDLALNLANNSDPSKGAAMVGYKGRTVADMFGDWANVRAEGATGDGVTVDKTACQAAINTGENVYFPAGQYQLGTADTGAFLTASADGQIFFFDAGAVLLASGNNGVFNDAATLLIDGKKNVAVIGFKAIGSLNVDDEQRDSPWGIVLKCTAADCLNTTIIGAYAENTQGLLLAVKSNFSNAFEVTGVTVDGYSKNSYYGLNCAYTGNGVSGRIQTLNNHRAYFAYGCYGHDIDVIDKHDGTKLSTFLAQSQIAAISYTGPAGKDTHAIKLRYQTKGGTYSGNHLQLTKSVTLGDSVAPVIYDVEIDYNDRGSATSRSIGFANFVNGVAQAGITGRAFDNITITGYAKNPFDLTHSGATAALNQSPQGLCNIEGLRMDAAPTGSNDPHNGLLFDEGALYGNQKAVSFTPRMYGSSTPGGARNGTTHTLQQGTAYKSGRIVTVNMQLAWTATTETGNMRIDTSGLPAEFRPRGLSNYTAVGAIAHQNIDFPGANGTPGAWAKSGQDWVDLIATTDNAGIGFAVVDAAGEAWITITWETN